MADTNTQADRQPTERINAKIENIKAAQIQEQHTSSPIVQSAPITPNQVVQTGEVDPTSPAPETTDTRPINMGQGENANGERDAKKKFEEGKFEVQGHTKITREAGDSDTGKPSPADVVQQGGGGAINAASGEAV